MQLVGCCKELLDTSAHSAALEAQSTGHESCRMSRDLIRAFSQKLARTERLQGGELRDYQAPLLSKLLAHARDNAEFYEQRLGFDVGSRDAIERMWRAIPILTRAEVVTNRER